MVVVVNVFGDDDDVLLLLGVVIVVVVVVVVLGIMGMIMKLRRGVVEFDTTDNDEVCIFCFALVVFVVLFCFGASEGLYSSCFYVSII